MEELNVLLSDPNIISDHGNFRKLSSPVMSWNEWDPLEEVIVGRPDNAVVPPLTMVMVHIYSGTPSPRIINMHGVK